MRRSLARCVSLSSCSMTTHALVVMVVGPEGGSVQMWDLEQKTRGVHRLFTHNTGGVGGRVKAVNKWKYSDEFIGG